MWSEYALIDASRYAARHISAYQSASMNITAQFLEMQASMLDYMPFSKAFADASRKTASQLRFASKMSDYMTQRNLDKPAFDIKDTRVHGRPISIKETKLSEKPYYDLLRFKKNMKRDDPKLLIVAPMSGHYASLLRSTVEALLPNHDVYIVDWKNPRDVDVNKNGRFDFEKYMDCLLEAMEAVGPNTHVMGISQSTVPLLAATAILNAEDADHAPLSTTLIGGPIDTRASQTDIHQFVDNKPLNWFSQNVIQPVPYSFKGRSRRVYPGYTQLATLMNHGKDRHRDNLAALNTALFERDCCTAAELDGFYKEYFAVMDLDEQFFLDTLRHVYKDHSLPNGTMTYKGKPVDLNAITKTALLTIEGGKDTICPKGETKAAHDLCKNIPENLRRHEEFAGYGHYGIAMGRRFRNTVAPKLTGFIRTVATKRGLKHRSPSHVKHEHCPHDKAKKLTMPKPPKAA